jgi:nucleotide-binding universal stress UspA family protein
MTILAAIDGNERSQTVIEIAADLAKVYDDKIVALHVIPQEDFKSYKQSIEAIPEFHDYSMNQEAESAKRFARKFVLETLEDSMSGKVEARGRVGNISDEILSEAESLDPRYLVISGRRRSPTGKVVFGSIAQKILLNAACPVVTRLTD